MTSQPHFEFSNPIPIDVSLRRRHGQDWIEEALRRIVRSTRTEWHERDDAFRILGPDMRYHAVDPHLIEVLSRIETELTLDKVGSFRSSRRLFDLCFEDSWTGFFVARTLNEIEDGGDVVFIHLDDHTDMMSTLLVRDGERLTDPARNGPFDPCDPKCWEDSIASGCIGIGSFVTALFYLDRGIHVRHLNNFATSTHRRYTVIPTDYTHPLIPSKAFAAVRKTSRESSAALGSYLGGPDADKVLASTPPGHVIVHIDLDYFINDFNGNATPQTQSSSIDLQQNALHKMDCFFDALDKAALPIARWIIATSPGFCSATHWDWLLRTLEEKIENSGLSRTSSNGRGTTSD